MKVIEDFDPRYDTVSWQCKSCHGNGPIPLSDKSCPNCGSAMPQEVRDRIYSEIRQELRIDAKRARQRRWRTFGSLCLTWWPVTLLVLLLLGVGIFRLVAPDAYQVIMDNVGSTIHGASETMGNIRNGIGRFLLMLLKGLWWVLMSLWNILRWLLGWFWELLVHLYENLPEILGWLWRALLWLWDMLCLLLALLWKLLKLFLQVLPSILSALWQFIRMLLNLLGSLFGLLWNGIKWVFSLIF